MPFKQNHSPTLQKLLNLLIILSFKLESVKYTLLLAFCFLFASHIFAGEISGFVFDKNSKEQLVGVSISIDNAKYGSTTSLDGFYSVKNIQTGSYKVSVSYIGYKTLDTLITFNSEKLKLDFYLEENVADLKTVTITAQGNGESELYAKKREQTLESIANIVSANAISLSPDVTVANAIQRMSGVSIARSTYGEGQYAIIRGMDKKYNTTLVNGVKIPSPDNKDRFVPLDMFPSELLERMEVYKSLTPSMEGDATGGAVNLVMKNAPDHLKVEGNIGAGYTQLFLERNFQGYGIENINPKSPAEILGVGVPATASNFPYQNVIVSPKASPINTNASLTIGNRFLNNKLGIVFSGSNQSAYKGSNSAVIVQTATIASAKNFGDPLNQTFSDTEIRQYSSKIDRLGLMTKIDYNFDADNSISIFATYLQLYERRARLTSDSLLGGYTRNGFVGSFAVAEKTQTQSDLQSISSATLLGKNKLTDALKMDWSFVASIAKKDLPDITQFDNTRNINPDIAAGTFTLGPQYTQGQNHEWLRNTDKDLTGYLNFKYRLPKIGFSSPVLSVGGMYRHKDRDNYDNKYTLSAVPDVGDIKQLFTSIPESKFYFDRYTRAFGTAAENPGIYTFNENITAGYGQLNYSLTNKIDVIGGLRVEKTDQSYDTQLPVTLSGKSGVFSFLDYLPSVQVKDNISTSTAIRFSYFRSILRPAYADKIPFTDNTTNPIFPIVGNPALQHSVVENLDIRYEVFGKGLDQFMVGVFYKGISKPIEYTIVNSGATLIEQPTNVNDARNIGFELVYRKYFGDFGVAANYTYTNSELSSNQLYPYKKIGGADTAITVNITRPLQGQSAHIGNFSFLYKNTRNKIDAQISVVYTGERISSLSLYQGLNNWEKATTTLDISVQKEFGKHFIVYGKANNLLNTPLQIIIKQKNYAFGGTSNLPFQESADYQTVQLDKYFASYSIGFRFKY